MGAEPIEKVSIIVSKGSFDGIYPGLIMANGARMSAGSAPPSAGSIRTDTDDRVPPVVEDPS